MSSALHIATFTDPQFAENTYLLWPEGSTAAWIIDPGFSPTPANLRAAIARHKLQPAAIVLTHCHCDHIAGIGEIRAAFPGIPLWAPRDETEMLASPMGNFSIALGLRIVVAAAERLIAPLETLTLGSFEWRVLDVAGHSPGGLALYCVAEQIVIAGDALFAGSIGRTDFPGSSHRRLIENIRRNLLALPDDTTVYSGHGPPTTIGEERRHNPFLQPGAF